MLLILFAFDGPVKAGIGVVLRGRGPKPTGSGLVFRVRSSIVLLVNRKRALAKENSGHSVFSEL